MSEKEKLFATLNGIKIELTEEQIKEYEMKKYNPFERAKFGDMYYCLGYDLKTFRTKDYRRERNDMHFAHGVYCTDAKLLEQHSYWMQLEQLLWKDAYIANKQEEFDFNEIAFFTIEWSIIKKGWLIVNHSTTCCGGSPIYLNGNTANEAINNIVIPFCENYPDFKPEYFFDPIHYQNIKGEVNE